MIEKCTDPTLIAPAGVADTGSASSMNTPEKVGPPDSGTMVMVVPLADNHIALSKVHMPVVAAVFQWTSIVRP